MRISKQEAATNRARVLATASRLFRVKGIAGNATLLYYMSEEAQEGRNAYLERRKPDFSKFPRLP